MTGPLLTRELLEDAFELLDRLLAARNVSAELYIFGGASIVFAYLASEATVGVDARFGPRSAVHKAAADVADRLGLDRSWLNDQAVSYLTDRLETGAALIVDLPHVKAMNISAEHLLVMKVMAARPLYDYDDIAHLLVYLGLDDVSAVSALCEGVDPGQPISPETSEVLGDLFERLAEPGTAQAIRDRIRSSGRMIGGQLVYPCPAVTLRDAVCDTAVAPGSRCPIHGWCAPAVS